MRASDAARETRGEPQSPRTVSDVLIWHMCVFATAQCERGGGGGRRRHALVANRPRRQLRSDCAVGGRCAALRCGRILYGKLKTRFNAKHRTRPQPAKSPSAKYNLCCRLPMSTATRPHVPSGEPDHATPDGGARSSGARSQTQNESGEKLPVQPRPRARAARAASRSRTFAVGSSFSGGASSGGGAPATAGGRAASLTSLGGGAEGSGSASLKLVN